MLLAEQGESIYTISIAAYIVLMHLISIMFNGGFYIIGCVVITIYLLSGRPKKKKSYTVGWTAASLLLMYGSYRLISAESWISIKASITYIMNLN